MTQLKLLLLVMLLTASCVTIPLSQPTSSHSEIAGPASQAEIDNGVRFLLAQLNPAIGLLRESPVTAPDRYWLMTDNWLANQALALAGHSTEATALRAAVNHFLPEQTRHGLIECLDGSVVAWPPRTPTVTEVAPSIWLEVRTGATMDDWREYADLTLYAAINAANQGNLVQGRTLYQNALRMFDGLGFRDKAFDGRYTTYKLALARIAALRLGIVQEPVLLRQLLAQQGDDGGFVSHYTASGPVGDANTETTAYALLALLD